MFESGYFLTIPQIIGAIRRRWFPASLLAFVITACAAVVLMLMPNLYESEGKIYLKAGRATLSLDPTATTGQTSTLLDTRQAEIQSIKDMIGTRAMLERVAEKVGIDRIMDQKSGLSKWIESAVALKSQLLGKKKKLEMLSEEEVIALERMEFCVEYIAKKLSIKASKEGNTISISAKAHTALLAKDIVQNIMSEFNSKYVEVHQSAGSLTFFEQELDKANQLVTKHEAAMRDLKDELQMMTVEDKRALIQQELSALQSERIQTEASLKSIVGEISSLEDQLDREPKFVENETTDKPNAGAELIRQKLYELEVAEKEMSSKYNDAHPMLVQVRDKIKESRAIYEKTDLRSGETKKSTNLVRQNAEIALITARSKRDAAEAKLAGLISETQQAQGKMKVLNSADVRLGELQRIVDQAREDRKSYAKKLEESRIQDRMNQSLISDLRPYQEASLVLDEAEPKRAMLLALVAVGAVFVGLAFAVWRDQSDYRAALSENGIPFVMNGQDWQSRSADNPVMVVRNAHPYEAATETKEALNATSSVVVNTTPAVNVVSSIPSTPIQAATIQQSVKNPWPASMVNTKRNDASSIADQVRDVVEHVKNS